MIDIYLKALSHRLKEFEFLEREDLKNVLKLVYFLLSRVKLQEKPG